MFDLNEILEEVRNKYYCSKLLKKPTISWSRDYWTDYFGQYTLYDNHITISRLLNDKRVSKEMLGSVVFHESLHQDFQEHDNFFDEKASLFPKYYELKQELDDYMIEARKELDYSVEYNCFTKTKKRLIYISLEENEDYLNVFFACDEKVFVDFNSTVNFDNDDNKGDLFVFLVKSGKKYHIVGWCDNGVLHNERIRVLGEKFDDSDYSYQLVSNFENTFVIPFSCCDYTIHCSDMPVSFGIDKCCWYDISNSVVQGVLDYINSYCEGYYEIGMDINNIDCIPPFLDVPIEVLKEQSRQSYAGIWLSNAIFDREPTYENLVNRAYAKYNAWMTEAALEDFIKANLIKPNETSTVYDIIKISVLLKRFGIASEFINKYKALLPNDNMILNNLYMEVEKNL